jgi:hypothetical protein
VNEIPNPQDDDPPADPNDPGLPPATPPPSTPTTPPPPPPPPADPSLAMSVTAIGGPRFVAVIDPATADPATDLTLSIEVSEWVALSISGWDCIRPAPGSVRIDCTTASAAPGPVTIAIVFARSVQPSIMATITALNYEDPDLTNNTVSWTG